MSGGKVTVNVVSEGVKDLNIDFSSLIKSMAPGTSFDLNVNSGITITGAPGGGIIRSSTSLPAPVRPTMPSHPRHALPSPSVASPSTPPTPKGEALLDWNPGNIRTGPIEIVVNPEATGRRTGTWGGNIYAGRQVPTRIAFCGAHSMFEQTPELEEKPTNRTWISVSDGKRVVYSPVDGSLCVNGKIYQVRCSLFNLVTIGAVTQDNQDIAWSTPCKFVVENTTWVFTETDV